MTPPTEDGTPPHSRAAALVHTTVHAHDHDSSAHPVSPFLRLQMRGTPFIIAALFALSLFHVVADDVSPLWLLAGVLPGFVIGTLLSHTSVLGWDDARHTIVSRTHLLGVVTMAGYSVLSLFRGRIVDEWVHSASAATVVTLTLSATTMLARLLATRRGIRGVLQADAQAASKRP